MQSEKDLMFDNRCMKCGVRLKSDEIALYRKLIYRGAQSYSCLDCQAKYLNVTREDLEKLIEYYHRSGVCSLFAKWDDEEKKEISHDETNRTGQLSAAV
jgi:DNA-directed RNA polymerase subunit RPC12/RpoP